MIPKGRAIVTEMIVSPAGALLALDLWDAADDAAATAALGLTLPGPGRAETGAAGAVLRLGPRRWWLDGAGFAQDAIAPALNGTGAVTAVDGGWVRVRLAGAGWRALMMESGLIDAEDPGFDPGSVAVTHLCHARCVIHVRAATRCEVFVPASYADHCLAQWRASGWQQASGVTGACVWSDG
jgi:heterotetrameric sarcosine oxidase gamma subunit